MKNQKTIQKRKNAKHFKNISFTINVEDQKIIKYKNAILEIAKYGCYCCQKLCFDYQVHYAS
jgi:hypothetical protein